MTPEQIRAAAAQAAATLMAPMQPVPADFVAVAEVIEAYIGHGKQAAFALCLPPEEAPVPQVLPAAAQAGPATPQPEPEAARLEPAPVVATVEDPRQRADVIPMTPRDGVSKKQAEARSKVEKVRKERVESIRKEASVAKVRAHKQRLLDAAEESELTEYPVLVDGETMTLGAYLGSLLGS